MIAMLVYAVGTGARREAIDRKRVLLGPTVGGGLNGYSGSRLNAVRFRGRPFIRAAKIATPTFTIRNCPPLAEQNERIGPMASAKNNGGRPPTYKKSNAQHGKKLCELGATDQEIADFFEVDVRTIYRWKHDHDEFCQALKSGKDVADERVERSLYQRAIGYEQDEVKIFMPGGAEEPVYAPFRAKVAPDTTAAIFWLKNRRSGQWRDVKAQEISGPSGGPVKVSEIRLVGPDES